MYFDQIKFAFLKNETYRNFLDFHMLKKTVNIPKVEFYFPENAIFDYPGSVRNADRTDFLFTKLNTKKDLSAFSTLPR